MAINKKITIGYKGKEHVIKVTMAVIDRLEDKINLVQLANRLSTGDIRFSHAAKLVSLLLAEAGEKVTQEEIYQSMFGDGDVDFNTVMGVISEMLIAIFPEPVKKPEAQGKRKAG